MTKKRPKLKNVLVSVAVFLSVVVSTCWSVLASDLEQMIQEKISERHPTDTPAWWRNLGPAAPQVMISLFDKSQTVYAKLRLVEALGYFDDADAVKFLKSQAENPDEAVLQTAAIRSVGQSGGAAEVDYLGKFLDNSDADVRTAAGQALKRISDPKALSLLEKFYQKETTPWVKQKVQDTAREAKASRGPLLRFAGKTAPGLSDEWTGEWKGVAIAPSRADSSLKRLDVTASLKVDELTHLKGEFKFEITTQDGKTHPVSVRIFQSSGKDLHVTGELKSDLLKEFGSKNGRAQFEADILQNGGAQELKLESRELLLTIIARKI